MQRFGKVWFREDETPYSGLAATISIWEIPSGVQIVNNAPLVEIADRGYYYSLSGETLSDYLVEMDAGSGIPGRRDIFFTGPDMTDVLSTMHTTVGHVDSMLEESEDGYRYTSTALSHSAGTIRRGVELMVPFTMVGTQSRTPLPGLTVTVTLSRDGLAFTPVSNTVTHVGYGVYYIILSAAEMDASTVTVRCVASGADTVVVSVKTSA